MQAFLKNAPLLGLTALTALGLTAACPAYADITTDIQFDLAPPAIFVPVGGSATFTGIFNIVGGPAQAITSTLLGDTSGGKLTNFSLEPAFTSYLNLGGIPTSTGYIGPVLDVTAAPTDVTGHTLYGGSPGSPTSGDTLSISDASGTVTVYAKPTAIPAAVPEAATTLSFGLLIALGLETTVFAARKRKAAKIFGVNRTSTPPQMPGLSQGRAVSCAFSCTQN